MVRSTIRRKANFDISKLKPSSWLHDKGNANNSSFPVAYFMHGSRDDLIQPYHSQHNFDCYPNSRKILHFFDSFHHDSLRPISVIEEAMEFLSHQIVNVGDNIKTEEDRVVMYPNWCISESNKSDLFEFVRES